MFADRQEPLFNEDFKAFLIIQESLMTISEDWQMAFRYSTLPDENCMCHNFL